MLTRTDNNYKSNPNGKAPIRNAKTLKKAGLLQKGRTMRSDKVHAFGYMLNPGMRRAGGNVGLKHIVLNSHG